MAAVAPFAMLLAGAAAVGLLFPSYSEALFRILAKIGSRLETDIQAAGMRIEPQRLAFILAGIALGLWVLLLVVLRPAALMSIPLFALCAGLTLFGGRSYLRRRRARRTALFADQLEGALRTLAGGVRVGLGIRQALVMTSEQCREPAKSEFLRVVGLSNVGVSILDAFDQLALRMTNTETAVLARVVRVQAQTGGDLGTVLEGLAATIRDRRRLRRKVKGITAQGRATAVLLGVLPIGVGGFVMTQDELRQAMLFTTIGQLFLGLAILLDALAVFILMKITKIDP